MARKARRETVIPRWPHHVTVRGNNKRRLFSYPRDYFAFVRYLCSARDKYDCELHAVALMSNHLHFVVSPAALGELSGLMQHTLQRYSQFRNRSRGTSGKLFEERYFCKPLKDDSHLATAIAYVDSNGFRAGLVATPEGHRWSTGGIHAGAPELSDIPVDLWTPSSWYLALGAGGASRATLYRRHMESYLACSELEAPFDEVARIEKLASTHYTKRLRRPDGSAAGERRKKWTGGAKSGGVSSS